jgi:hypothetical protein
VGGANIKIVHYFNHGYLEDEKSMIHSFTVTFEAKYLTGMATTLVRLVYVQNNQEKQMLILDLKWHLR